MNPDHSCGTPLSTLRHWNYDQLKTNSEKCIDDGKEWFWCRECKIPVQVQIRFPQPKPVYTKRSKPT